MSFLMPYEHFCASSTTLLLQLFNSSCHFLHYYSSESSFAAGNGEPAQQYDMKCSTRLLVPTVNVLLQSSSMVCMWLSPQFAFSMYFLGSLGSCFCFTTKLGEMLRRHNVAEAWWCCTLLTCQLRATIQNNSFCGLPSPSQTHSYGH